MWPEGTFYTMSVLQSLPGVVVGRGLVVGVYTADKRCTHVRIYVKYVVVSQHSIAHTYCMYLSHSFEHASEAPMQCGECAYIRTYQW